MLAVAFVVVVLVVVTVVVIIVRRPRGGDVHSVANYNHALGTLEHLSDRIGAPTVRPVRVVPVGRSGVESRVVPPVPVRGTDEFPDPDAPIVFDDARPVERGRPGGSEPTSPARADRAQRMALDSMNRRNRPSFAVIGIVLVIVVFGVLAIVGSQKSNRGSHASATATTVARAASPRTSPLFFWGMAVSMMARILTTLSESARSVAAASVTSRVMKTARDGGPSALRRARPRVSSVM